MNHEPVVLEPINMFHTPKDFKALEEYIHRFNGGEFAAAVTCAYMAWNLAAKLTNPENKSAKDES